MSINKPFKQNLKEKYISFCIDSGIENIKISKIKIISFICDTWPDSKITDKDFIYKSFRATGAGNSEDNLLKDRKEMENEQSFIDNDLEEEYIFDENSEIFDDAENLFY